MESTSILLATLSELWKLPLEPAQIMTHAEAADLDGYGPSMAGTPAFERWDLWKLKDTTGYGATAERYSGAKDCITSG